MPRNEDETLVLMLAGLWMLSKYAWEIVPALEQQGAALYEWLHDDPQHQQDLPGHQMTRAQVLELATRTGFADPKLASAIAFAESGGVPNAVLRTSREYSVGLWQINTRAHPQFSPKEMADPIKNAQAAYMLSAGGRAWNAWSTFNNGKYKQFLTGIFA